MINYSIRTIQKEDNPHIASIIRNVLAEFKANKPGTVFFDPSTDNLYSVFSDPKSKYWIVESYEKILGGAGIYPTEGLPRGYCEMVKLYLLPETRGKGLGKVLIEKCFESARDFGFTHIYLESMPELNTAISLYEKYGFEHLQGPLGNSGHFGCDVWMVKKL
jgi:putative acetyltransferase